MCPRFVVARKCFPESGCGLENGIVSLIPLKNSIQKVHIAQEGRAEPVRRVIVDGNGRAGLGEIPFFQHRHLIRHGKGFFPVVGHIDSGDMPFAADPPDLKTHGVPQFRIQIGERFIQQKHRRIQRKRPGKGDPLLLTAGEGGHFPVDEIFHPDQRQHFFHPVFDLRLLHAGHLEPESDIFIHIHVRPERIVLKDHGHVAFFRRETGDILAVQQDPARICRDQARENAEKCGFTAAGGTKQKCHFAIVDGQGDIVEHFSFGCLISF